MIVSRKTFALFLALAMLLSISAFTPTAHAENMQFTMNTNDTNTLIDTAALGYTDTIKSLGYGESITFNLTVPASEASYYQVRMHGSTTGQSVYVIIKNASGAEVFSRFHKMNYAGENISGLPAEQIDGSNGTVKLDAGTYSVLIMNGTENTTYGFKSLEFRDVMLPLGSQKTAFKMTDAYYYALLQYHYTPFKTPNAAPENVVHVGGTDYYHLLMDANNAQVSPDLRYYIVAEEAGQYELSIRSYGRGGFKLSVNDAAATEVLPFTDTAYEWRTDVCTQKITLNKGLNDLRFTGGGRGSNALSGIDCFMLESVNSSIPLNTKDTHTKITSADIGYTTSGATLAKNESISFKIKVSDKTASKYITHLTSGATGATVSLSVTDANGAAIFDKSMQIARTKCLYSGAAYQGKDGEGAVMDLTSVGTYTVTLKNLSDSSYTFKEIEFRNVILPLGDELTAFHSTDAYHQNVIFWHSAAFSWYGSGPDGVTCVGGSDNFTSMLMQQTQSPVLKYWIYAENAGEYNLYLREFGFGGIKASVNSDTAVTFSPHTDKNISSAASPVSNNISHYVITPASSTVHLNKGLNTIEISGGCVAGSNYSLFTDFQLERITNAITLNEADTNTVIAATSLGSPNTTISIGQNDSISFDIRVTKPSEGTYLTRISGTTTGQILTLSVIKSDGTTAYNKSQDMTRATDDFTGVSGTGVDYDGANMMLSEGIYTVTLTNNSDTAYGFKSIEFRNLILPLDSEKTAFKVTDAYYRQLNHWHCTAYTGVSDIPENVKHIGGEGYYLVLMQEHSSISPELRFYVRAETAGEYILQLHTKGHGGIKVSINGSTPTTTSDYTAEEYDWKMDTFPAIVQLNKGINTISLQDGALASVNSSHYTSIDYFTLEPVQSVWQIENAICAVATENSVTLKWNPRSTEYVSGWEVYKDGSLYANLDSAVTSCTFNGLDAATEYEMKVKAIMTGFSFDTERTISVITESFAARENSFTQISAGKAHFIGINKNGRLQSFGNNNFGQASTALPTEIVSIATGATTSYAIDKDGNAYAWGNNAYGQAGIGSNAVSVSAPTKLALSNVSQISGGTNHALILTVKGEVYATGDNRYGQLGSATDVTQTNAPLLVSSLSDKAVIKVYAGPDISFAICADGSLYAWGINYMGQLGNGDSAFDPVNIPVQISLPGKALQVVSGSGHTAILCYNDVNGNCIYDADEATSVYVCGADSRGQLATGKLGDRQNTPIHIAALDNKNIISLAAGDAHTLALSASGNVYGWGWNEDGQLGIGDKKNRTSIVPIENLPAIISISAGYTYSIALAENGSVYAWGTNSSNQVTLGTTACYTTPVLASLPLGDISIGNTFLAGNTLTATCYNDMEKAYTGVVRVCLYTEENGKPKLASVVNHDITLASKERKDISVTVSLPENTENMTIKVFAWDTGVNPYAQAAVLH